MSEFGDDQKLASALIRMRHDREALFPPGLFDEFAWEILLALYAEGKPMRVEDAIERSAADPATGLRWVRYLVEAGQITVEDHLATMAADTARRMATWLARASAVLVPLTDPDIAGR